MRNAIDLTGQRFGKFIAVRSTEERNFGSVVWECICDCGNTAFVGAGSLRSGKIKSCGCLVELNIAGQRFGKLIAVGPTDERRGSAVVWECKCDCGNTTFAATRDLRSGNTKSCGCLTNALDLAGQRFGRLTAVRPTEERLNRQVVWECKCDCGNTAFAGAGNLRRGSTKSCGCLVSEGDYKGSCS